MMAFLNSSTYTENDLYECIYCSQKYPAQRDLAIHEYLHGNDVREAIFNLAIQPRNSYLLYEDFTYVCGNMKSGLFGKEVGCAETPEQDETDETDETSQNKDTFDSSSSAPLHFAPYQDVDGRQEAGTNLFSDKTFEIEESAKDMLKSVTGASSNIPFHVTLDQNVAYRRESEMEPVTYETFHGITVETTEDSPNTLNSVTSASLSASFPGTPDPDAAYRPGTDFFKYKTCHGGIEVEPTENSASMLKSVTGASSNLPFPATLHQNVAYRHESEMDPFIYEKFHGGITVEPTEDSGNMLMSVTDASSIVPFPATFHQDVAYRREPGAGHFAYKTFPGGNAGKPAEGYAKILVKYETFPRRTNVRPPEKWADRYKTSVATRTDLKGSNPTVYSESTRCGSSFRLEQGFELGGLSREINT